MITESHEEIRRLLVQGANRIRETASIIGLLVKFKQVWFIFACHKNSAVTVSFFSFFLCFALNGEIDGKWQAPQKLQYYSLELLLLILQHQHFLKKAQMKNLISENHRDFFMLLKMEISGIYSQSFCPLIYF